jgi:hypothetical protein
MAMRSEGSEAKRLLRASGVGTQPALFDDLAVVRVDEAQVGVIVSEIESGSHLWLFAATIHGGPILLPGRFRAHIERLQTIRYCVEGRSSHPIFGESHFHALG